VRLRDVAEHIRGTLNAYPARQIGEHVPTLNRKPVSGVQHKYRETVLFFPIEIIADAFVLTIALGLSCRD
jgi:hypothetical protein